MWRWETQDTDVLGMERGEVYMSAQFYVGHHTRRAQLHVQRDRMWGLTYLLNIIVDRNRDRRHCLTTIAIGRHSLWWLQIMLMVMLWLVVMSKIGRTHHITFILTNCIYSLLSLLLVNTTTAATYATTTGRAGQCGLLHRSIGGGSFRNVKYFGKQWGKLETWPIGSKPL